MSTDVLRELEDETAALFEALSEDEFEAFLAQVKSYTPEQIAQLERESEAWAAGVVLGATRSPS